jgi:hypothetical protein
MKYYILERDEEDDVFLALQVDPGRDGRYFGYILPQSILVAVTYKEAKALINKNTHTDMDLENYSYHIVPEDELALFHAEQKLRKI